MITGEAFLLIWRSRKAASDDDQEVWLQGAQSALGGDLGSEFISVALVQRPYAMPCLGAGPYSLSFLCGSNL